MVEAQRGLAAVARLVTNGFCCPLCVRALPLTCATLAHAPSESVGGGGQTFLCKACNSFLGTAYEAGVDAYISAINEAKTSGTTTTNMTLGNKQGTRLYMEGVFSGERGDRRIEAKPRGRNKAAEERFNAQRQEGDPLFLRFQVPGEENTKLAYLSWAYLLLFRRLGYAFVFSEAGRLARSALLSGSLKALSPAILFTYGDYEGETSPVAVGLLTRMEPPDHEHMQAVAIAAEIGQSVVSLPLGDDPEGRYQALLEYTTDGSELTVVPFDVVYPGPTTAMPGVAAYKWRSQDGALQRILATSTAATQQDLSNAVPPPSRRPRRDPLPDNPDWPPPTLPMPPEPRRDTWRALATEFLEARGIVVPASTSDDGDAVWIASIGRHDPVAASHVIDMRTLFREGVDPRSFAPPGGIGVMTDLQAVTAELDPDARIVAADFRLVASDVDFGSLSLRLVTSGADRVVGPHYTYRTLVAALRAALVDQNSN